jgi:metal-responsive CopG/Arc/MetJ family transcriptional regulator
MKTAFKAELPEQLLSEAQKFVAEGGAADLDELLAEALRRYIESHSTCLTESFVREDVSWGLRGRD